MNAPLSSLAQVSPDQAYEQVSRVTDEVAGQLARQLRQHTQGDVRFEAADRGRYATDASIYQCLPLAVLAASNWRAWARGLSAPGNKWARSSSLAFNTSATWAIAKTCAR